MIATQQHAPGGRGYTRSLLVIFVIPFVLLLGTILRTVRRKPFFATLSIVSVLGWAWSMLLSRNRWWVFPARHIIGVRPLPHVPLEEFVIYPIGGAFSIFLYILGSRRPGSGASSWNLNAFTAGTTAAFLALGLAYARRKPHYLFSQLVLYNGISLLLSPVAAKRINLSGLAASVSVLGLIGFVWDHLAFRFGWWRYNATTGVRIFRIPVEDVNFYLMAPTAAISLYVAMCRRFAGIRVTKGIQ